MDDIKRGDDAADHVPRQKPANETKDENKNDGQDAPNYDRRTDRGEAIRDEDVSSANDE